jgi:hypothetical protein
MWVYERNRTRHLRQRFGPEYDRAVMDYGDRRQAESELKRQENRLLRMDIRPLNEKERDRFRYDWRRAQERFVDDPKGAVWDADQLVDAMMRTRGYDSDSLEERIANVAAIDPARAAEYRVAVAIALDDRSASVPTEELRRAFITYRDLFDLVLGDADEEFRRAA